MGRLKSKIRNQYLEDRIKKRLMKKNEAGNFLRLEVSGIDSTSKH